MRYAIFGGAGFIGANLVELLLRDEKNQVFCFDNLSAGNKLSELSTTRYTLIEGDMLSFKQVDEFMTQVRPDRVYHLVANSNIAAAAINPQVDIDKTLMSTLNLVNSTTRASIKELVFASSSAVYGPKDHPINEDCLLRPISSYGWMKLASEKVLLAANTSGRINKLLVARFPNVTGLYQTHGVVHDLVIRAKNDSNYLKVLGNGKQTKPYIDAGDLALTLETLIEIQDQPSLILNISPKDRCSVEEIALEVLKYAGKEKKMLFEDNDAGWPGDVPNYELETTNLLKLVPNWSTKTSLEAIQKGILYMWNQK